MKIEIINKIKKTNVTVHLPLKLTSNFVISARRRSSVLEKEKELMGFKEEQRKIQDEIDVAIKRKVLKLRN